MTLYRQVSRVFTVRVFTALVSLTLLNCEDRVLSVGPMTELSDEGQREDADTFTGDHREDQDQLTSSSLELGVTEVILDGSLVIADASEVEERSDQEPSSNLLEMGLDMERELIDQETPPLTYSECFEIFDQSEEPGPDYDRFSPVIGSHCAGTNYQEIEEVQQVIFLGDSVTQGTPNDLHPLCIDNDHFFRVLLANWLADTFGLDKGDLLTWEMWESYNCTYNGRGGAQTVGDFSNCARWGARADDFMGQVSTRPDLPLNEREAYCQTCCSGGVCGEERQCIRAHASPEDDDLCGRPDGALFQCIPEGQSSSRTLFVFTIGGNDISKITEEGGRYQLDTAEGQAEIEAGYPTVWKIAYDAVTHLEEAVQFMKDPARFPNGSYVVMGGPFEFTDGTGEVSACQPRTLNIPLIGEIDISALGIPIASLAGLNEWVRPEVQREIVLYLLEQYMRITVEYQIDYVWVLEHFCGHGYVATGPNADLENECYREDDPTLWFDLTCTHPNDLGHAALFHLFREVIAE